MGLAVVRAHKFKFWFAVTVVMFVLARELYVDVGCRVFSLNELAKGITVLRYPASAGSGRSEYFWRSVFIVGFGRLVCLPALRTLTARTAVTIFFASDSNLFLSIDLIPSRKVGGERRVVTFPSGALLFW